MTMSLYTPQAGVLAASLAFDFAASNVTAHPTSNHASYSQQVSSQKPQNMTATQQNARSKDGNMVTMLIDPPSRMGKHTPANSSNTSGSGSPGKPAD